ncbi:MAG TPA: cation-translocating P-type ATPase [Alloiococcus sp.]|nr:cation-translocating P-type ATPase [Alloiococcus sp.]
MEKPIYQQSQSEILKQFNTSESGLSDAQVKEHQKKYGLNELNQEEQKSTLKMFFENFKDPMVIILLIVAIIQIALGEVFESTVILAIVILSAVITVIQEKKAAESLESLRNMSSPTANVIRDGKQRSIEANEVVPGDLVTLEVGDFIPADGRLIDANSLQVDEGALTGESVPAEKEVTELNEEVALGDRTNMVFSSTLVTNGRGSYIVTGTGNDTEIGKVANLIQSAETNETPLQRKIADFSVKLGWGILALSIFIFALSAFRIYTEGTNNLTIDLINAFMFAVAVAVAAIPEALQSIITIVLSTGTNKMAKKHAIIRRLPAVETLGSTSIICTDKTGTLTQNKMTVVDAYIPNQEYAYQDKTPDEWNDHEVLMMNIAVLSNDSYIDEKGNVAGDPTEAAFIMYTNDLGKPYEEIRDANPRIAELPFDSDRKLMSTLHEFDGKNYMLTKGGPDVIFNRASKVLIDGEVQEFTEDIRDQFVKQNEAYSKEAKRVLAFAYKQVDKDDLTLEDENDLVLVGLMAMIDPPRQEVYDAIEHARHAGIRTVMITGDHKTTAQAIAESLNFFDEDDIALTGSELDKLSDDELLEILEKVSVYARVTPENKIRIVKAWQSKDQVTAMTGDGVNDAPALKQADIGVAMGSGTDVAKDASAMVLTDDNFVTIVNAVEVGRNVYNNIKKSISYLFSGNLGAVLAIIVALIMNWVSPFTALQLLFINLVNDALPAIALGLEPSEAHVMKEEPRDPNEGIFAGGTLKNVLFRGITIAIAVVISQYIGLSYSAEMSVAMAFTTLILARSLQVFPARSTMKTSVEQGFFKNKFVVLAFVVCMGLYGITLLPFTRELFSIPVEFGLKQWAIAAGLALATTIIMELKKVVFNR